MSFRRPEKPKSVKQKSDEDCWAAALESWLDAVPDPNRRSQEVLIKHSPGGIKTKDFRKWAQSFGMSTRWLVSHKSSPDDFEFTPDYIEELLKKSALFVSLEVEPEKETMWFHCVVLYAA
jgi:hypothetical protein